MYTHNWKSALNMQLPLLNTFQKRIQMTFRNGIFSFKLWTSLTILSSGRYWIDDASMTFTAGVTMLPGTLLEESLQCDTWVHGRLSSDGSRTSPGCMNLLGLFIIKLTDLVRYLYQLFTTRLNRTITIDQTTRGRTKGGYVPVIRPLPSCYSLPLHWLKRHSDPTAVVTKRDVWCC